MSILDTEQSARYIDALVASVQALEADLAATRDKLRQVMAALGVEPFTPDEGPILDLVDIVPIAVSRAGVLAADFEQAQARIAALEQELDVLRPPAENYNRTLARAEQADDQSDALWKAIDAVLSDPYGCPFCDSGKLRNPDKGHTAECGFALMQAQADARGREET